MSTFYRPDAEAGDTVYLLAGTFTNEFIRPYHSGTSDNPIVFCNYEDDTVTIQDANYGIRLDNVSYIIVEGINFYYMGHFLYIQNQANHNIVGYCVFDQCRDTMTWGGARIYYSS